MIVHYTDLTLIGDAITANPALFGLASAGACNLGAGPGCISDPAAANQFLFYVDELHLTSAGFAIVARYVQAQLTAPLPLQAPTDVALDTARQFGRTLTTRMDLGAPRDGDMPEGLGVYLVGDTFSRTIGATDQRPVQGHHRRPHRRGRIWLRIGDGRRGDQPVAAQGQFRQ